MKVKQLISMLSKLDGNMDVLVRADGYAYDVMGTRLKHVENDGIIEEGKEPNVVLIMIEQ